MKFKSFMILIMVAVLTLVILASCESKETFKEGKAPRVIRIGGIKGSGEVAIAKNKQLFEKEFQKEGVQIQYTYFDHGPAMIESFISGKIDIGTLGDQPIITAIGKGLNAKIIANQDSGYDFQGLLVPKDSPIKSIYDLKGKKIATTIGTVNHHLLSLYLEKAGIKQSEIQLINVKFADCLNAIETNNVDATVVSEPQLSLAQSKGVGKVIETGRGYKKVVGVIAASDDFTKEYPDITARILKVYDKARNLYLNGDEEAIKIAAAESLLPKDIILKLSKNSKKGLAITDDNIKEFKSTYNFLRKSKVLQKDVDIEKFYDRSFLIKAGLK
ncbi:ABC transporter substrate-binding protein [Clostridium cylindrosporum]|uniref:Putative aliphatic sulfonates-binding protein n=1 Tax=Clostridium cylindrosporum DSM 605 TaxID=1121307 RepID=A0A0J8DDR7_CLOCY|nr:NrtA/SsuA/CpmA family ABC transporter substrate-binding protein [Clostridium cylindrosporum]KMT22368.1 putative aliphatic sulfonates-binding protein SsuA [Clostridium cylindrosporum DSM 605]